MRTTPSVLVVVLSLCVVAHAQEDEPTHAPGLIATLEADGHKAVRIDEQLSFDWETKSPDGRLPQGSFTSTWVGRLFVQKSGRYQFHVHSIGQVSVELAGSKLLETDLSGLDWNSSKPTDLAFGYHSLKVTYRKTQPTARLGLYWESGDFELEPIPHRHLLHDPTPAHPDQFERGASLVHAHRCAACHGLPTTAGVLRAPSLAKLKGTVHEAWLTGYLEHPTAGKAGVTMPDFALSAHEAKAVGSYLWKQTRQPKLAQTPKGKADDGKKFFERVGCLACHSVGALGLATRFGGGELGNIAAKRPSGYFEPWLKQPEQLNTQHRMPVFDLEKKEVTDLSAYLATLGNAPTSAGDLGNSNDETIERGKRLIADRGCANCHEIPGVERQPPRKWETPASPGCLGEPAPAKHQPGYRFVESDRVAIQTYLQSVPARARTLVSADRVGRSVLEANNCLSCHSRGSAKGLRDVVAKLGVTDAKAQAALVPPALESLGDKLNNEWLKAAVAGQAKRLRPWLAPRMPRFPHTDAESELLVRYFVNADRLPDRVTPKPALPSSGEMLLAAHRLIGGGGFGCMSCHSVGSYEPKGVELGARGSDLRNLGTRMRHDWFRRWTRNPARIVPGMEMPAITTATPGILDSKIGTQLEALWHGLNAEHLSLPSEGAVQVLSAIEGDRTLLLRDPFEHGEGIYTTRPLAIGLPNRQNLLLDLDWFALRQWWIGDFARQKTRGKTWYWESAGIRLLDVAPAPLLLLRYNDTSAEPASDGQAVGWLKSYEHTPDGAKLGYRIQFPKQRWVSLELAISASERGVTLAFEAKDVPSGAVLLLRPPIPKDAAVGPGSVSMMTPVGPTRLSIVSAGGGFSKLDGVIGWSFPFHAEPDAYRASIRLSSSVAPPAPVARPAIPPLARKAKPLPTLPGYEVLRLPVPDGPMPTAMAWLPNKTMAVTCLKGDVYLVRDSDNDDLLDTYQPFADHLAAPYGLEVDREDLIVAHKPELVRLIDRDKDGRAERTEVIATGWGVTFDYHDWTVGPLRDGDGNWYVALQCQQDDRSSESAKGRGKVVRISPSGDWTEYAAGVRFFMGLAMSPKGEIFATDNQGVTNPFNELNHVRAGRHYGFFNKLEKPPAGLRTEPPAIQIPHPWTRSVNAIVFIPDAVDFGPFRGQLIGADFTNRMLIRMSLQQIGDTYQGCAYPFSKVDLKLIENDETFFGPISMAFGPDRNLWIGGLIDSGWGGGNNRGTIERVRWIGPVPFGIREVRARADGFDIDLTGPVNAKRAADSKQYTISCYRRIPKGGYATEDQDRTSVTIERVIVNADGRSVRLDVAPMKPGFVYDLAIGPINGGPEPPFPDTAYYTYNAAPAERH